MSLQPAALILAESSAATHVPVATLSALLGIVPGDFVTPAGLSQISAILGGTQPPPLTDAAVPIAAIDPLWPTNLVPHIRPLTMPASAARQVETILQRQPHTQSLRRLLPTIANQE